MTSHHAQPAAPEGELSLAPGIWCICKSSPLIRLPLLGEYLLENNTLGVYLLEISLKEGPGKFIVKYSLPPPENLRKGQ